MEPPKIYVRLRSRVFAFVLDYLIYFLVFSVYTTYFREETESGYHVEGWIALPIFIFWFFYFVIIESYFKGTLGKIALHQKVVCQDGSEIGISHAIKRHFTDWIELGTLGIVGIILIKNTALKQRLGDVWAKTIVIKTNQ